MIVMESLEIQLQEVESDLTIQDAMLIYDEVGIGLWQPLLTQMYTMHFGIQTAKQYRDILIH